MPERKVETDFLSTKYFQKELEAIQRKTAKVTKDYKSSYNEKVLIGNWQEKSRPYVKTIYPMKTNYNEEFTPPKQEAVYNDLFDYKIRGRGTNWHTVNDQGLPEQFYNNFSTLYDLNYNKSCPKLLKKKLSQARPQHDFTDNYGNTNHYGILEYMQRKWENDKKYGIHEIKTTNQETFVPQETTRHCVRRSPYKAISSSFCKITTMHQDFNTRNKKICVCADYPPELICCPRTSPNLILPSL